MLETPLFGRFLGEGRRLFFGPPEPYLVLVRATVAVGAAMFFAPLLPVQLPFYPTWWHFVGALVSMAGAYAYFSLVRIVFDLRERTYRRWQGGGVLPMVRSGRLADLESLRVIAVPSVPGVADYFLVLHWKGAALAPMVLRHDRRALPSGAPLHAGAVPLLQEASRYAPALGISLFDQSHVPSPHPVALFR